MPLQRRLPKRGFRSRMAVSRAEIRLHELSRVDGFAINLDSLKAAGVVAVSVTTAKVILSGSVEGAYQLSGVAVTKGARQAIEKAGGTVL